jgi:solute carrier family 35 protein E3
MMRVVWYMALNFVSSVGIIWANKLAYRSGFTYATSLTVIHFIFTYYGLKFTCEPKKIPLVSVLPISLAFCGFVVFNNLSLQFNPIGTYQLFKVMTTPTIVHLQYLFYDTKLPFIQMVSLIPVCVGVVLATVGSVETDIRGLLFGIAGIVSTSIYQIWVKTEQNRLECSSEQLLYYQAPLSAAILVVLLPLVEDISGLVSLDWVSLESILWVLVSSILAFLVNLSIFLVIGKTSPVSYNVLGHGKLCVILISGYIFFGDLWTAKTIIGIILAVGGIVWYTHLKLLPPPPPTTNKFPDNETSENGTRLVE